MKKRWFLLWLCLPLIAQSQSYTVSWADPIAVTPDESYDNNRPRLALNNEDQPVVIWGKDNGRILYLSLFDGTDFSAPFALTSDDFDVFVSDWAGPEIDANGDVVFAVFKRYPENMHGAYAVKSIDGGQTWSDTVRVDNVPIGDEQTRFPNVVVDANGNPAVTMMTFVGNYLDPKYEIVTSVDGGDTFSDLVNSSTELFAGEACDCCTADITFDGNQLVQLYRNNYDNIREIRASRSMDWGASFPDGFAIDLSDTYSNVCFSSGPSGYISGDVLLSTYRVNTDFGPRVGFSAFDMVNDLINIEEHLAPTNQPSVGQTNPKIAGNEMYTGVVWQEEMTNDDNVHFVFSHTGPSGLPGADVQVVNLQLPGKQINPDIAFANDAFHVVWQDKATGLVMYRKGEIVEAVSVSDILYFDAVQLYPNPASDMVHCQLLSNERVRYRFISAAGETALEGTFSSEFNSVNVSQLAPGIYSLTLNSPEGNLLGTKRFCKY